jgi:flavin-dependent dehydrogenase
LALLETAAARGARVHRRCHVRRAVRAAHGWSLVATEGGAYVEVSALFVIDAAGRAGVLPRRRRLLSPPTIALYGYWRGERFTSATRIVAMNDHWCWGALLPDNRYSAMVFADPGSVKHKGQSLDKRYRRLILESGLIEDTQAELDSPTRACDATAYVDAELVGEDFIKVGEAGLALDPLSSTGVQKAVQSSLVASCSVHTILERGDREAAREFYVSDQLLTARPLSGRARATVRPPTGTRTNSGKRGAVDRRSRSSLSQGHRSDGRVALPSAAACTGKSRHALSATALSGALLSACRPWNVQ